MRLLSLNVWGGRQGLKLFDYLADQAALVDFFCFQEVFSSSAAPLEFDRARLHLFEELQELLVGFQAYFEPSYSGWVDKRQVEFPVTEGQALFVRKAFTVSISGSQYIYGNELTQIANNFENEPKSLQYAEILTPRQKLALFNVHGLWHPGHKRDAPERLRQSQIILETAAKFSCPKIICGDFNLLPSTTSIKILESSYRNLIKQYHIHNTRNRLSWQQFGRAQYYADFTFVSSEIKVKSFTVPYNEVSDHLPMILEFNL